MTDDEPLASDQNSPVTLPVTDVLDLHAFHPRQIPEVVAEYLDEAAARGFREVRLIHGKGIGFQRERVRQVLATHPRVEWFGDAPAERGHWGATLVRLLAALCVLMALRPTPAWSGPPTYPAKELAADLRQVRTLLESRHPALYAFTDRGTFDSLFAQAQARLDRPMTSREFYQIAAPIVARVGCGHTTLTMATDSLASYPDRFLPLRLFVTGDRAYVRGVVMAENSPPDTPDPGAELLSINGIPTSDLLRGIRATIPSDGRGDGWKTALLNGGLLYDRYALLIGFPEEFELTFRPGTPGRWARGGLLRARLPAVPRRAVIDPSGGAGVNRGTSTNDPHIDFALSETGDVAVLTIQTFAYYQSREKFDAVIDGVFARLRAAGCRNLILDLRGNSGGDPFCSSHLLAYLAPAPIRYFARIYPSYASLAAPLALPENRFHGNLYTLIDGGCFSSTGHLCALLKFHRIGTFIGSETGGTYECNDAAHTDTLAVTGLRLRVARATYTVAVEGMSRGRGVAPDYAVEPSIQDILAGRDPAMERARSLIERRGCSRNGSGRSSAGHRPLPMGR